MYTLARKLVRMNTYVHDGRWQRHSSELHAYRGRVRRITGQTVGIVGLGHVGRQVAWRRPGSGCGCWRSIPTSTRPRRRPARPS